MSARPIAASRFGHPLPRLMPANESAQLILFGVRRVGSNGLSDAATAQAFLSTFGCSFRRPLTLLRAFMAEVSGLSAMPIQIAPGCCSRMTDAEGSLIDVLACVECDPERARLLLSDLLGVHRVASVLASANALANSFADAGMPIIGSAD